jgi:exodeoxyribonuclease-1
MLDVVRMTRALRPGGIEWPVVDGKEVNKLELITKQNGIDHFKAHDALSDVEALIAVTKLIKEKQPQLYTHLFAVKDKKKVTELVNLEDKKPFVYVSGRLDSEFHKATVAFPLTAGRNGNVIVYDLRYDPAPIVGLTGDEVAKRLFASWEERQKDDFVKVPVKELQYNRAPAVAPVGVLEREGGWERIGLDLATIEKHRDTLLSAPAFAETIRSLFERRAEFPKELDAEAQLYDGFVPDTDKLRIGKVRQATANDLADLHPEFVDERLNGLLLHYKARNFPQSLAEDEVGAWEEWRATRIKRQLPDFVTRLQQLAATHATDETKGYILQELQLWAESIVPFED